MSGFEQLIEDAKDPAWVVGTNVEYGLYLEMGTRNHPPYPWLRPAISEVASKDADKIADNAESAEQLVAELALAIERKAKELTDSRNERPFRQSGNLSNSIEAVRL